MANPLRTLNEYGQSVWLDFVSRDLLKSGGLTKLIAEDGLRGVTSNPSIFEKAIGHGDDYDAQIAALQASGDLDPGALFERLAVTDIQNGAEAPKVRIPRIVPRSPVYRSQPRVEACSTATRRVTLGGNTDARYASSCCSNNSHDGMLTTLAATPSAVSFS